MKRALLVGSQTGGLTGVHADVAAMDDVLTGLGFTAIPTTGADATADGIVERYQALISDTGPDDTAVFYYSGHGGRQPNPLAAGRDGLPAWLQYILPTDCDDRSGDRVRCILAEELSALQAQLTARSRNVTTIMDCCHSARMSRGGSAVPKANDQLALPAADLVRRWRELAAQPRYQGDANPDAVRVVACAPDQSAYEDYDPYSGERHGMLTAALVRVLRSPEAATITWSDALEVIRGAVSPLAALQRPEVEGPAQRLLFSVQTRDAAGLLPVRIVDNVAVLPDAAVFGVTPGDRYDLMPPSANDAPLVQAVVERIDAGNGVLSLTHGVSAADLPAGTSARPAEVALTVRPVAVLPVGHPHRQQVAARLDAEARVRSSPQSAGALATVLLGGDDIQTLDAGGQPLYPQPLPLPASLGAVVRDVRALAIADHVRDLPSGSGDAELLADVTLTCVRVLADGTEAPMASGEHVFAGDRLRVRATNTSAENRYLSVFDIGLSGAVSLLTTSEPSGITLRPGEQYLLGQQWPGGGMPLAWPRNLPADEARLESLVVVLADRPVDRLRSLGQPGAGTRRGGAANDLERLVDDLAAGRRDIPAPGNSGVRWRVKRFDLLLHPAPRPAADEPAFEIDERPDPSLRLAVPRGVGAPRQIAVRLKELTVHSNRSFLRSRIRVDAMVITAAPAEAGGPYRASTMRFDRIADGDRLPFDDVLIYAGPVARFLDLAIWVAKDDSPDTDLADLLASESADHDVAAAIGTLAGLAVAAPAAAVVAGSVAAVAVLVRAAARLIDKARGSSIGVYRTTLLPAQAFGTADGMAAGTGRHPAKGLLKAQDMSFAYEVIDLDTPGPGPAHRPADDRWPGGSA